MKIRSNVPGHMTKMASRPIDGKKILKNLLLRKQEADDLVTWYTATGTQVLPNLFKRRPYVDLDHFYDSQICFIMLLHG